MKPMTGKVARQFMEKTISQNDNSPKNKVFPEIVIFAFPFSNFFNF